MLGTQPLSPFGCVGHQELWKIHRVTVSPGRNQSAQFGTFGTLTKEPDSALLGPFCGKEITENADLRAVMTDLIDGSCHE